MKHKKKLITGIGLGLLELAFTMRRYPQFVAIREKLQAKRTQEYLIKHPDKVIPPPEPERKNFQGESTGTWVHTSDPSTNAVKWSGGVWHSTAVSPEAASEEFMQRHVKEVLGVEASDLQFVRKENTSYSMRIIYKQTADGLSIYNSNIVLEFDDKINLVAIEANVYQGLSHSVVPTISMANAAATALKSVQSHVTNGGGDPASYTAPAIQNGAEYIALMKGANLINMYHFNVPLRAPLEGALEIFIDATSGELDSTKIIAATSKL